LKELDAVVVGISGDDIKNLQLFREANQLNFTLLSDPDGNIAERFGVPVNKEMKTIEREVEGVKHLLSRQVTTSRWTFVIDKKGTLIYKSTQVNAAEDSKAVINVLEQQQ
jgi:thioredoxin-dependent peroxiredoxin